MNIYNSHFNTEIHDKDYKGKMKRPNNIYLLRPYYMLHSKFIKSQEHIFRSKHLTYIPRWCLAVANVMLTDYNGYLIVLPTVCSGGSVIESRVTGCGLVES
jgi:hypothetical protein